MVPGSVPKPRSDFPRILLHFYHVYHHGTFCRFYPQDLKTCQRVPNDPDAFWREVEQRFWTKLNLPTMITLYRSLTH